jgi:hypothetical protein
MPKLQISISGLCMYVPRQGTVSVLMPRTGGDIEQHVARLIIERKAGSGASTFDEIPLEGCSVTVAPSGGGGADASTIPQTVLDIHHYSAKPIPVRFLEGKTNEPHLISRLTLAGGRCTESKAGARFELDPGVLQCFCHALLWEIDVAGTGSSVDLQLISLRNGALVGTVSVPVNGNGDAPVRLFHMPSHHLPTHGAHTGPRPPSGTPISHYAAYYGFTPNPARQVIPKYQDDCPKAGAGGGQHVDAITGSDPVTCGAGSSIADE